MEPTTDPKQKEVFSGPPAHQKQVADKSQNLPSKHEEEKSDQFDDAAFEEIPVAATLREPVKRPNLIIRILKWFYRRIEKVDKCLTVLAVIAAGIWFYYRGGFSKTLIRLNNENKLLEIHVKIENKGDSEIVVPAITVAISQVLPFAGEALMRSEKGEPIIPTDHLIGDWPLIGMTKSNVEYDLAPGEVQTVCFHFAVPSNLKCCQSYINIPSPHNKSWEDSRLFLTDEAPQNQNKPDHK